MISIQMFLKVVLTAVLSFFSFDAMSAESRISRKDLLAKPQDSDYLQLLKSINQIRLRSCLKALDFSNSLSEYALKHSRKMANGKVDFGHGGFEERAAAARRTGRYSAFGENLAYSYGVDDHLKKAAEGWMQSSSHRANILGDYDETGIGIAFSKEGRCYITQLFAKRVNP
jgi:uncharacterized protein YkwD